MTIKIIAEIGANHNGDMTLAKEMIWAAAENGANYAKFQSWLEKDIVKGPWDSPDPFFQFKNKRDFYKNAQLSNNNHFLLMEECKKAKIEFLTTCFNYKRLPFLKTLGIDTMKISSFDAISNKMIDMIDASFDKLIISTGMTKFDKVKNLINRMEAKKKSYALLHCVSIYPTPIEKIKMSRFLSIKNMLGEFGEFGISDHSLGSFFPKVAVSLGAKWIEKHFTIDKRIPGPDNFMSINPQELNDIRSFCNEYKKLDYDIDSLDVTEEENNLKKIIFDRFGSNR